MTGPIEVLLYRDREGRMQARLESRRGQARITAEAFAHWLAQEVGAFPQCTKCGAYLTTCFSCGHEEP